MRYNKCQFFVAWSLQTLCCSHGEVKPYVCGASGFSEKVDYVRCLLYPMFSMGKEQELLDAARSGNITAIEKILSQKNKWSRSLLPQQLTPK